MSDLKELIEREMESFIEWDGDDKSIVTTTSAKLFAEHVAGLWADHVVGADKMVTAVQGEPLRYTNDGALAECPCCGSLDVGGAHDTVHCYSCDLTVTKPRPLQNAIDAWNTRTGRTHPAPAVQREPVGEVRFELGAPSSIFAELYSKSLPVLAPGTKLYAAPQPAEQQPAQDVAALEPFINKATGEKAMNKPKNRHRNLRSLMREGSADFDPVPARQPAPDVKALVEALTELCDEIDNHDIHSAISKTNILWFKRKARAAMAAYRKQKENK